MNKRKHLTQDEVGLLLRAARDSAFAARDHCMLQMCFYHGLRVSELIHLKLSDIDLSGGKIFIRRLKKGLCTMQPLTGEEIGSLNAWLLCRRRWRGADSDWLFISRLGTPFTRQYLCALFRQYGIAAGLSVTVHPHMLRHACGYALADNGSDTRLIQDYLGHRNIRHTVIYTAGNSERFNGIWEKSGRKNLSLWPKAERSIRQFLNSSTLMPGYVFSIFATD